MLRLFQSALFLVFFEVMACDFVVAAVVSPVAAHAWPNERTSNQFPSQAIDGSLSSYTWSTESFNTSSASLGLRLGSLTTVSRIRLWKDANLGEPGWDFPNPKIGKKDLLIQYTTDPTGALSSRTWVNVSGLSNGYHGSELLSASSVNSNGSVTGDSHDSFVNGWASLSFNPVSATGIRVFFSKTTGQNYTFMHYRVYELEVYNDPSAAVPEPCTFAIFSLGALGMAYRARRMAKA